MIREALLRRAARDLNIQAAGVRLAAMEALGQALGRCSFWEHVKVIDIIAEFVLRETRIKPKVAPGDGAPLSQPVLREDIQAALYLLGKRPAAEPDRTGLGHGDPNPTVVKLPGVDLRGYNLSFGHFQNSDFSGADLSGARLEMTSLSYSNLRGALLREAYMPFANFEGARLVGADLSGANADAANFSYAKLKGASLRGARVHGASFWYANLKGADLERVEAEGATYRGSNCFPEGFDPEAHGMDEEPGVFDDW